MGIISDTFSQLLADLIERDKQSQQAISDLLKDTEQIIKELEELDLD